MAKRKKEVEEETPVEVVPEPEAVVEAPEVEPEAVVETPEVEPEAPVKQRKQEPATVKTVEADRVPEEVSTMIGTPTHEEGPRTDVTSEVEAAVVKTSGELARKRDLPAPKVVYTENLLVNTGFTI